MSISCIDLDAVYIPEHCDTNDPQGAKYGTSLQNVSGALMEEEGKSLTSTATPLEHGMRLEIEGRFTEAYDLYKANNMLMEARRLKMLIFAESQRLDDRHIVSVDTFQT